MMPTLSFGIPAYNAKSTILETISDDYQVPINANHFSKTD